MTRFKKQLPEGVEDILPLECFQKSKLEQRIKNVFINAGYDQVSTPTYEYYDAFANGVGSYLQEKMIKFFDLKGSILTLRPDLTIPIARMATSKLMDETDNLRLFYLEKSFRIEKPAVGRSSESFEAGIELLGEKGIGGDVEAISLAIESLLACDLDDFKIDMGQVSYFKSLIKGYDFDDKTIDEIRHLIDAKNEFELNNLLDKIGAPDELKDKLCGLMKLFGGKEVFLKAKELCGGDKDCLLAVDNLESVYDLLCSFGFSDYICIDFGLLHDISYYTGIIFRGITDSIGFPIITGGRYDNLLDEFGKNVAATGFTLFLKRVLIVLERLEKLSGFYKTDFVVSCDTASSKKAYEFVCKERTNGKRAMFCVGLDKQNLLQQKKQSEAEKAVYFDKDGEVLYL